MSDTKTVPFEHEDYDGLPAFINVDGDMRKCPKARDLHRWQSAEVGRAVDGCLVPTYAEACEHGEPAWLYLLGLQG